MVKVAEEWLNICGGCEVTILDIGEPLLDLLPSLEFVHIPVLMDHKYHGQTGEGDPNVIEIPEADVGIISGGVRNEKEKHVAEAMRKSCKTLIALGACACNGGIPAMANMDTLQDLYSTVYKESESTEVSETPAENLPPLLDRVYAVDEVVPVDIYIPGCPTNPALIVQAITALLEGKPFELPEKSVCDTCPTKREKKAAEGAAIKRPLDSVDYDENDWENTRCFMEQGILCQGPVTLAGCAEKDEDGTEVPRCVKGYMPCRGCFGPVRKEDNPMVSMMGALSSIGFNARDIEDRKATLSRYVGAHNKLRPMPKRPGE
ncbi:MAG: methyl viologen-reducing hydrogenase [Candidatus Proteinoplasmatales archaeon SG8-5]|nr:MAG: methyl viologen-reducing hydrogenase [Candidatus Proteinoplasmatales archaeon SG8-5]